MHPQHQPLLLSQWNGPCPVSNSPVPSIALISDITEELSARQ